ncbi:site-specific integrase [Clostridium sp.]|uniref:tyrosine-type recombinase/integrase n=1 Tax=Clostridium sp. TaxID=1506 RepID=UPI002914B176|nr:site-specific integrase [Clostridium sp.]MDU4478582.1 site-specific integrase [Clostridium sp.]
MASYRKVPNGKWEATIDLGRNPSTGKRMRKFKGGFKTKKEAIAYVNSLSVDISNGLNVIDNKVLLKDFIISWYTDYKIKTISLNTQTNYESRINNYIIPQLGNISLDKLTTATVQQFYNGLINKGLKPNSCKKIIETLSGCLKYAKKLKLINYLPTDIEKISQESKKVIAWDDNQLKFFLRQIKDTNLYLPALIISLTGLRIGEMCGLRWNNVDLNEGVIYIREQVIIDKTNHKLIHTEILKTNTAFRSISIPPLLIDVLSKHKLEQPENNIKGFVILDKENNMCNPRNVSMDFTKKVAKYKDTLEDKIKKSKKEVTNYMQLPQISIHGLRHTHATILLLKGENIKVISERLGHKSTKITWDTYSHVLPSMKKQTADLLDDVFNDL